MTELKLKCGNHALKKTEKEKKENKNKM